MIISANQFILIPPEQYHEITSFEPDTIKLVFGFDAELTDKVMNKKLKESECSIHTETNYLRKLAEVLCTLPEEHSADASHSLYGLLSIQLRCTTEAFFFSLLQILITEEIPTEIPDGIMKSSYKQNLIDNMILLIRNNTGCGFISVDDIAEAFHISKRHLDRICVEITGKTSRKILDEERLRYIRTLLSTTQYTLHEIAFLTGFSNEQSLVRFFHRNEGYPPAQYRKKILK